MPSVPHTTFTNVYDVTRGQLSARNNGHRIEQQRYDDQVSLVRPPASAPRSSRREGGGACAAVRAHAPRSEDDQLSACVERLRCPRLSVDSGAVAEGRRAVLELAGPPAPGLLQVRAEAWCMKA